MRFVRFFIILSSVLLAVALHATPASAENICYNTDKYDQATIVSAQSALGVYPDGIFGPKSCAALIAFQQSNEPPLRDAAGNFGRLGPKTLKALGVSQAAKKDNGQGRRIVIDQSTNTVQLFDSSDQLVGSGGMVDNPKKLPKGTYYVGNRQQSGVDDHSGKLWLPNFVQFYGNIGFHKIPVRKSDNQPIHDESYLGTNNKKSAGCIRLGSEFSDTLWQFARIGIKVVVI